MESEFKFDGLNNTIFIDGYRSITRTGNGIFSIGKETDWNSFVDATSTFSTTNLSVGSLTGLLKATSGTVSVASSGTDYEPPVTKGNLTSGTTSAISISDGNGSVIGGGTSISINKASAILDGYLGKDDWSIFANKIDDSILTTRGDILYRNASNVTARLSLGLDGYVLTSNGTDVVWDKISGDISLDTTYYVDGDNGSDSNNGLSWETAKKTMSFLYSGDADAIPREINAVITIRTRGTILSKDENKHTVMDGFYGSGYIQILGETQDVVTGLVPTGYDNTTSSVTFRSYVEVDSATWSIDEYKGMFVQITNPSTDTICPIISNTATRIETTGLSISGANTFKIIKNLTSFRSATVSNPGSLINYPDAFMINSSGMFIPLKISSINTYDCNLNVCMFSTLSGMINNTDLSWYQNSLYVTGCNLGYAYFGGPYPVLENCYVNGNGIWFQSGVNQLWIDRCAFIGSGSAESCPIYLYYSCMAAINHSRIINYDIGVYCENAITLQITNNLIESCNIAFNLNSSVVDSANAGFNRFKDNEICINLSSATIKIISPESGFYGSGNTSDIVVADTPHSVSYSFSDIVEKKQIYNTKTGGGIVYYEDGAYGYKEKTFVEYDNTTSGLDSYFYQGAIDLLATSSHSPVTLNASAVTGGLSLNVQELSFRAATNSLDGYLKSSDWITFNGKVDGAGTVLDHSVVRFNGTDGKTIQGSTSYVTDDGYIGVKITNPLGGLHVVDEGNYSEIYLDVYNSATNIGQGSYINFRRARGTISSKTIVQDGDILGSILCSGWDGNMFAYSGSIQFVVDGTQIPSSGSINSKIIFNTDSFASQKAGMINKDGYWFLGTDDDDGTPDVGRLVVAGKTSDGLTNIFVGRNSSGANVATLDSTGKWTMANATIGTLTGLLKATSGVVSAASSGTDYEPPVTKGNLTSGTTSAISISNGSGSVIGGGTSISINKASVSQDGYLGKDDFANFSSGSAITKYDLSETASSILTIVGGTDSVLTNDVTIQVKKASVSQDGYLSKGDWSTFNGKGDMDLGSIQTNTATKTFNDTTLVLAGSSSGTTTLKANATAGTTTQTFQAVTGNVYCSGGTDVAYTDGGTGLSTYPTRTIILLAGGAALGTTTPATRETREMATNKQVIDVLKFAVAGVNIAWFCFPIPDAFDSGTFVLTIQYFNATADSGKFVVFQAAMSAAADGEAIDIALGTTQIIKSSCSATGSYQKWATFPAITASPTPAPSHMMFVKFWRDPAHADDDSTQDVYVESLKVEFVANSWSD